jgi:2-polyprenyl-3-methyl-5-hydroxy-6-metoxy-1,4-benzoquinol methylase
MGELSPSPEEPVGRVNELTTVGHWDDVWAGKVRMRLPSPWVVSTRNLQRLLRPLVRPGDRVLEIGCAPGKMLAWVAAELGANVSGLDYSEKGLATARTLFSALGLHADFRCEDLRATTYPEASFDVVFSVGVIEHFDDPRDVVHDHLRLLAPGGTALMTVPNYRGIYGRLQAYFDKESLLYHNLDIMTCDALKALVPADESIEVRSYPAGRVSPWMLSMTKRWPAPVVLAIGYLANTVALLQPVDVTALCPMLVLNVRRAREG